MPESEEEGGGANDYHNDRSNHNDNDSDSSSLPRRRRNAIQCFYECLGAPVLVYRGWDDHYALRDEEEMPPSWLVRPEPLLSHLRGHRRAPVHRRNSVPVLNALAIQRRSQDFLDEQRRLGRVKARWHLPLDAHVIRPKLPHLGNLHIPDRLPPSFQHPSDAEGGNGNRVVADDHVDWAYYRKRSLLLMEEARANQLMAPLLSSSSQPAEEMSRAADEARNWRTLRSYQRFDRNWVLEGDCTNDGQRDLCRQYDQERTDNSDPSYLAPFSLRSLEMGQMRTSRDGLRELFEWPLEDPNYPHDCGNSLLVVSCQCRHCLGIGGGGGSGSDGSEIATPSPTWFLLHPCGPLLERVSLSCLTFPNDPILPEPADDAPPSTLDVDDTVRQLIQCGTTTYLARTRIHCVIFTVQFGASASGSECGRRAALQVQCKLDLRTLAKGVPYYVPACAASHPRYGNRFVDPMIAVLLRDANSAIPCNNNTIERVHPGKFSLRRETHVVTNLLEIVDMDFSAHHPMVLWSAARSHVRPAVTPTLHSKTSHFGLGGCLYSVDLRCNQGTFQWSPSHEMFVTEGIHSISGVHTDWKTDHSLWVASESARHTWHIDARMPVRPVSSWSSPHILDAGPDLQNVPPMGVFGAGHIFAQPERDPATCRGLGAGSGGGSNSGNNPNRGTGHQYPMPVLAVSLNPLAHGIHVYQRPTILPRLDFKSLEADASPGLARQTHMSVAVSSVFPFCDASDRTFACGLAAVCVPVVKFLSVDEIGKLGYGQNDLRSVMCAFTMTNRGDVYSHNLLESHSEQVRSVAFDDLPLGATAVALPDEVATLRSSSSVVSRPGLLYVPLSNQYPVPSSALAVSSAVDFRVLDLSRESERYRSRAPQTAVEGVGATATVRSNPTSHFLVQKGGIEEDDGSPSELILPFEAGDLHDKIDEQLAKTVDRYDHESAKVVEKDEGAYRSDVTKSFAALAAQAWPSLDDDTDDDYY
jgi:hypothetical protein